LNKVLEGVNRGSVKVLEGVNHGSVGGANNEGGEQEGQVVNNQEIELRVNDNSNSREQPNERNDRAYEDNAQLAELS
jgi:hypothetical protein